MAKLKINNRFGIIPNELLNNSKITFKAKGLFGYLQSKPEDWDFSANRIKFDTKESKDAINSGLQELERFGYLQRVKFQDKKGFWDIEYILYERPVTENPIPENPTTDKPATDKPATYKNKDTKKEIIKQDINNNVKLKKTKVFSADSFEYSLAYKFLEAHKANQTPSVLYKLKNNSEEDILQSFAGGLDKLKRLDEYKEKEIEFIINFVISDNKEDIPNKNFYWLDQIQTIDKLRKPNKEKTPYFVALIEPAKKAFITNKQAEIGTPRI